MGGHDSVVPEARHIGGIEVTRAAQTRTARQGEGLPQSLSLADVVAEIADRRILYTAVALVIIAAALGWAFFARPVFRSEATLGIESGSSVTGSGSFSLGGLASLAGLPFGTQSRREEIIAALQARGMAVDFISREGIAPMLLDARWDPERKTWVPRSGSHPINPAYAYEVWKKQVLHVSEDLHTGLVKVAFDWYDPDIAAKWNADFLRFTDSQLRDDALREAESSIAYLDSQMTLTRDVEVRRSIADLLEQQLKSETLAKSRTWYALRVIDPPAVPIKKFKPNRALIIVLGLILALLVVFLAATFRRLLRAGSAALDPEGLYPVDSAS